MNEVYEYMDGYDHSNRYSDDMIFEVSKEDKSISIIRKQTRFNTSHVTLYHLATNTCALQNTSFNTSHVTLYRKIHSKALLIL